MSADSKLCIGVELLIIFRTGHCRTHRDGLFIPMDKDNLGPLKHHGGVTGKRSTALDFECRTRQCSMIRYTRSSNSISRTST